MADEFDEWVRASYPVAYRTAALLLPNPADAQEAVQEAFLRVWRFRDAIPSGDGRRAWLYRVVVNTCHSRGRAAAARPKVVAELDPERPVLAGDGDGEDALVRAADVRRALAALPDHLRAVVVLTYYVGLVDREVGVALGKRPGTIRARLLEARRRLAADPRLAGWAPTAPEASNDL
jgi:RNA polymerase sigma-70 factor (ECF subfamily)